ncbi:MAG: prepilin-type N-terminal cleavage/methylation domain-containing protein [Verrucomicrobiota bacterium JB024]|nr:prepilin-type N-terminal cleavage/methylation domain-containing protein [Verrucomicrobiota bacterium JB024]
MSQRENNDARRGDFFKAKLEKPQARMRMMGSGQGFSLIELLAVIAIVGILAAILIPVAASVRESMYTAKCQSNLRQIGGGLNMYLQDNNNVFPGPLIGLQPTFYTSTTSNSLAYFIAPYLSLPAPTTKKQYCEVFACPAALAETPLEDDPRSYLIPLSHKTGYLFGYSAGEQEPKTLQYAYEKNPSEVWILRDRGEIDESTGEEINRHKSGNNHLFLDGSVRLYDGVFGEDE